MKRTFTILVTILALISLSAVAQTKPLTSLTEIMDALKTGQEVRAIFYYKKCQLISENKIVERVPDAIGGMTLDTFEYFAAKSVGNPEGFLSSSKTVLINHPSRGIVYNYAKVRIYESGKIQIVAQYLDPKSYEIVMDESFYTNIGEGALFFAR